MTKQRIARRSATLSVTLGLTVVVIWGMSCDNSPPTKTISVAKSSVVSSPVMAVVGQVEVRQPYVFPLIATGTLDEHGQAVMANCGTCHATRPPNAHARIGKPLSQFHQGLVGPHGELTCASCHHAEDGYQSLRLADGSKLPFSEVMTLCAQCHGPQYRDYLHGAHGGMAGYWDLSKGGRQRNHCIDCHDPHAPSYPMVQPSRGPNDRFLPGGSHE